MTLKAIVGTRGSALALGQTHLVATALQTYHSDLELHTQVIHTQGDRDQHSSLRLIGGQGAFIKDLEAALIRGEIDMAVHSLKDVPAAPTPTLKIRPVLTREDARDALVTRHQMTLAGLPSGARVGTGSARRAAQLRCLRPDLAILDIRGNVDTRLRKLDQGDYDAIVLAAAGLRRLNREDRVAEYLTIDQMLPAPCQGILAVEIRDLDEAMDHLVAPLVDPATETAALAERAFLARLGAGCRLPVAAYATVEPNQSTLTLRVMLAYEKEPSIRRAETSGCLTDAVDLGRKLAEQLLAEVGEIYAGD